MWITWNGKRGDPDSHTSYGIEFVSGEPVEVDDEKVIAKLKGNPFFTVTTDEPVSEDEAPKPRRRRSKAAENEAA